MDNENSFSRDSTLFLKAVKRDGKTIIDDLSFSAPFKVMRPFYIKENLMTVMLLSASAGIMDGDRQFIELVVERGAAVEFTSQAYEKIHRMNGGFASRTTKISVEPEARLLYTPLPAIPFEGSDFRNKVRIDLSDETSEFIMSEILTCGRLSYGEHFKYDRYENEVTIYENGKLTYRDNTRYLPKEMALEEFGFFEGFTHLGTLILCNTERDQFWITKARKIIDKDDLSGGISKTDSGYIVIKILAKKAERIESVFEKLLSLPN